LVQKRGYLPSSRIIDTTTATTGLGIELVSTGQRSVLVSEELHHLGDGNFEGQINSRFQESVEGGQLEAEFRLNRVQANAQKATLAFTTRGVQAGNEIRINGVDVGTTDLSDPDGSVSEQRITVDSSVLDSGVNSLSIVSVEPGTSGAPGDIDDFEVSNVRLLLGGVPQDGTKPTLTIDAPSVVEPGTETRLAAIADDNNRIRTVTMTLNHRGEVVTREMTTDRRLTLPATLDAPGTYTLLAQAVDQSGNVRERSVDIEVREAVGGGGATQTNEENLEHTLVIQATSTRRTFYEIRVDGDVNYEPEADTQTEADPGPVYPDKIQGEGTRLSGSVSGGADAFTFSGDIESIVVDGGAEVYVDDELVRSERVTEGTIERTTARATDDDSGGTTVDDGTERAGGSDGGTDVTDTPTGTGDGAGSGTDAQGSETTAETSSADGPGGTTETVAGGDTTGPGGSTRAGETTASDEGGATVTVGPGFGVLPVLLAVVLLVGGFVLRRRH
jgi:hypothetical protein